MPSRWPRALRLPTSSTSSTGISSPQNMLISMDGKVKVADFWHSQGRFLPDHELHSGGLRPLYISPEQARGGYSDERSDLYSLGITMFEMVTGRVPFGGDNTVTVALAHLEEPIPLPSLMNPGVTPSFERIILKCTEKSPRTGIRMRLK